MNNSIPDVVKVMNQMGLAAKDSVRALAIADTSAKVLALTHAATCIRQKSGEILAANQIDAQNAKTNELSNALVDRLKLDESRLESMASGLEAIASFEDPVGRILKFWTRPNGLRIERVSTPLGVIGVIYESRPNVTADAGALCLMAGNAVILRGGSDSENSSRAIHACLVEGLKHANLPPDAIQLVPTTDRAAVGAMLTGLHNCIDVIVPRGGKSLVGRVQAECRVPVFAHLEGICHIYVDATSSVEMATDVVTNAKMRRPGICGAAETLLIEQSAVKSHLAPIVDSLVAQGCEIRGDETVCGFVEGCTEATEEDWSTEYLAPILSVKAVSGLDAAIDHVRRYSSGHTESILSNDEAAVERFLNEVDSAILMHNASTQFADGGEFGMGAEIGIATGKMHARGPIGLEQLTSFKYRVRGDGQVRP
jgi:glutamate-5-semialdehyde dehydrogenase